MSLLASSHLTSFACVSGWHGNKPLSDSLQSCSSFKLSSKQ